LTTLKAISHDRIAEAIRIQVLDVDHLVDQNRNRDHRPEYPFRPGIPPVARTLLGSPCR